MSQHQSDCFDGLVFIVETLDSFFRIDYESKPEAGDWVVVGRPSPLEIVIERYRGQPYVAVARSLSLYPLIHSEQWVSMRMPTYPT